MFIFLIRAVELYLQGITASEIMREYGISEVEFYHYINESKEMSADHVQVSALEVQELRLRIRELELNNNILKKVVTLFAKR